MPSLPASQRSSPLHSGTPTATNKNDGGSQNNNNSNPTPAPAAPSSRSGSQQQQPQEQLQLVAVGSSDDNNEAALTAMGLPPPLQAPLAGSYAVTTTATTTVTTHVEALGGDEVGEGGAARRTHSIRSDAGELATAAHNSRRHSSGTHEAEGALFSTWRGDVTEEAGEVSEAGHTSHRTASYPTFGAPSPLTTANPSQPQSQSQSQSQPAEPLGRPTAMALAAEDRGAPRGNNANSSNGSAPPSVVYARPFGSSTGGQVIAVSPTSAASAASASTSSMGPGTPRRLYNSRGGPNNTVMATSAAPSSSAAAGPAPVTPSRAKAKRAAPHAVTRAPEGGSTALTTTTALAPQQHQQQQQRPFSYLSGVGLGNNSAQIPLSAAPAELHHPHQQQQQQQSSNGGGGVGGGGGGELITRVILDETEAVFDEMCEMRKQMLDSSEKMQRQLFALRHEHADVKAQLRATEASLGDQLFLKSKETAVANHKVQQLTSQLSVLAASVEHLQNQLKAVGRLHGSAGAVEASRDVAVKASAEVAGYSEAIAQMHATWSDERAMLLRRVADLEKAVSSSSADPSSSSVAGRGVGGGAIVDGYSSTMIANNHGIASASIGNHPSSTAATAASGRPTAPHNLRPLQNAFSSPNRCGGDTYPTQRALEAHYGPGYGLKKKRTNQYGDDGNSVFNVNGEGEGEGGDYDYYEGGDVVARAAAPTTPAGMNSSRAGGSRYTGNNVDFLDVEERGAGGGGSRRHHATAARPRGTASSFLGGGDGGGREDGLRRTVPAVDSDASAALLLSPEPNRLSGRNVAAHHASRRDRLNTAATDGAGSRAAVPYITPRRPNERAFREGDGHAFFDPLPVAIAARGGATEEGGRRGRGGGGRGDEDEGNGRMIERGRHEDVRQSNTGRPQRQKQHTIDSPSRDRTLLHVTTRGNAADAADGMNESHPPSATVDDRHYYSRHQQAHHHSSHQYQQREHEQRFINRAVVSVAGSLMDGEGDGVGSVSAVPPSSSARHRRRDSTNTANSKVSGAGLLPSAVVATIIRSTSTATDVSASESSISPEGASSSVGPFINNSERERGGARPKVINGGRGGDVDAVPRQQQQQQRRSSAAAEAAAPRRRASGDGSRGGGKRYDLRTGRASVAEEGDDEGEEGACSEGEDTVRAARYERADAAAAGRVVTEREGAPRRTRALAPPTAASSSADPSEVSSSSAVAPYRHRDVPLIASRQNQQREQQRRESGAVTNSKKAPPSSSSYRRSQRSESSVYYDEDEDEDDEEEEDDYRHRDVVGKKTAAKPKHLHGRTSSPAPSAPSSSSAAPPPVATARPGTGVDASSSVADTSAIAAAVHRNRFALQKEEELWDGGDKRAVGVNREAPYQQQRTPAAGGVGGAMYPPPPSSSSAAAPAPLARAPHGGSAYGSSSIANDSLVSAVASVFASANPPQPPYHHQQPQSYAPSSSSYAAPPVSAAAAAHANRFGGGTTRPAATAGYGGVGGGELPITAVQAVLAASAPSSPLRGGGGGAAAVTENVAAMAVFRARQIGSSPPAEGAIVAPAANGGGYYGQPSPAFATDYPNTSQHPHPHYGRGGIATPASYAETSTDVSENEGYEGSRRYQQHSHFQQQQQQQYYDPHAPRPQVVHRVALVAPNQTPVPAPAGAWVNNSTNSSAVAPPFPYRNAAGAEAVPMNTTAYSRDTQSARDVRAANLQQLRNSSGGGGGGDGGHNVAQQHHQNVVGFHRGAQPAPAASAGGYRAYPQEYQHHQFGRGAEVEAAFRLAEETETAAIPRPWARDEGSGRIVYAPTLYR